MKLGLFLNKIFSQEKLLCRTVRGSAEIGIIISSFFMFIFILLPFQLFVQELNYYSHLNQKVRIATEMACFDSLLNLDSVALSQTMLRMNKEIESLFEDQIESQLPSWIEVENLDVDINHQKLPSSLNVAFEYKYVTQFLLAGHIEKKVVIKLEYELPIDN